jgi:hypothetical protein
VITPISFYFRSNEGENAEVLYAMECRDERKQQMLPTSSTDMDKRRRVAQNSHNFRFAQEYRYSFFDIEFFIENPAVIYIKTPIG